MVESDLPIVLEWRNHPAVRKFMVTQHEISPEEHYEWFLRRKGDVSHRRMILMDGELSLGFVQFSPVSPGGIAEWGFYACPDAPSGTGRIIGQASLHYAFAVLGLHKVYGKAIEANLKSIAFHQKMGFSEEGRLQDQWRIDGKYHTVVCFGLLRRNWNIGYKLE
jgi:UDP-4-amino-4,6-dideoxy-N-acetyl-beta-L-altrosamine N-acetyltransferase